MDPKPHYFAASPTHPFAGRPLQWPEVVMCRFPARTTHRARQVLQPGETLASFIRLAVGAELARREQEAERAVRLARVVPMIG